MPAPHDKDQIIRFRINPEEREAIARAARLSGLTVSAWLRQVARETAAQQLQGEN